MFHGYGQLAVDFIKEFEIIKNENTIIVAPEAMNKFYLHGFYGKIGATWMTKEDRENEINDYIRMIDSVYNKIIPLLTAEKITINVLGFSQGTHTVVRWLNYTGAKIDNLILWSGAFPHDCDYKAKSNYWAKIKVYMVVGKRDKFLTDEKVEEEKKFLKSHKLSHYFYKFNGGHEIEKKTLLNLLQNL